MIKILWNAVDGIINVVDMNGLNLDYEVEEVD